MATGVDVRRFNWIVSRTTKAWTAILALVGSLASCGASYTYSADAIDARVVDATTGNPVPGVNVVAEWVLKGGMEYGEVVGYANVMETITDQDGRFHFSAWGPIGVRRGKLRESAPAILLFKPGYKYTAYANASVWEERSHLTSRWNEKDLALPRANESIVETNASMSMLHVQVDNLLRHHQGPTVRRFLCSVATEGDRLKSLVEVNFGITTNELHRFDIQCNGER